MKNARHIPEKILQFLWQYQVFPPDKLVTVQGESLTVLHPGQLNLDSGPDFLLASITLNEMQWGGAVEIHQFTSQWQKHGHHQDAAYQGVILHVVWENDGTDFSGSIPILEMIRIVPLEMYERYRRISTHNGPVPCAELLPTLPEMIRKAGLHEGLEARMKERRLQWEHRAELLNQDFLEVWKTGLCMAFGMRINHIPFEHLAGLITKPMIQYFLKRPKEMNILLMGLSGLHAELGTDEVKEWKHFKTLFNLNPMDSVFWKKMRTRPSNHPAPRIKQLAIFLATYGLELPANLYNFSIEDWLNWLQYPFIIYHEKCPGIRFQHHVLLNAILPFIYWVSETERNDDMQKKTMEMMKELPTELNRRTKLWEGLILENAGDSQALIYIEKHLCQARACLQCRWGKFFLTRPETTVQGLEDFM